MNITVNIPKNNYVQPTEVRQDIVQDICSHIIYWMNCSIEKGFYSIRIYDFYDKSAELYVIYDGESMTHVSGLHTNGKIDDRRYPFNKKVRTCEMKAVFKAMQKAGYHIFASHNITDNVHTYVFSKAPVLNGYKAKKIDFTMFID